MRLLPEDARWIDQPQTADPDYRTPDELRQHFGYIYRVWDRATGREYIGQHRHVEGETWYEYLGSGTDEAFAALRAGSRAAQLGKSLICWVDDNDDAAASALLDLCEFQAILEAVHAGRHIANRVPGGDVRPGRKGVASRTGQVIYRAAGVFPGQLETHEVHGRVLDFLRGLDRNGTARLVAELRGAQTSAGHEATYGDTEPKAEASLDTAQCDNGAHEYKPYIQEYPVVDRASVDAGASTPTPEQVLRVAWAPGSKYGWEYFLNRFPGSTKEELRQIAEEILRRLNVPHEARDSRGVTATLVFMKRKGREETLLTQVRQRPREL